MTAVSVLLLADVPGLIPAVGRIRWTEWGRPPEPVDPHGSAERAADVV